MLASAAHTLKLGRWGKGLKVVLEHGYKMKLETKLSTRGERYKWDKEREKGNGINKLLGTELLRAG